MMAAGPSDWCRIRFGRDATPQRWPSLQGAPKTPGSALSFFGSLGEAATPCFRKRLDPRMGSKSAQEVTDMVADRFTT
jgi:hypothetical protein